MLPRFLAICLSLTVAPAAFAHDFWIQPVTWRIDQPGTLDVTLQVGHGPYRQRSPIPVSRIVRFDAIAADGRRTDVRHQLHMGAPVGDATILLALPGTWLLALETDYRAESHLPAVRYNDYLRAEGLIPALDLRGRTGTTEADGAENYARHAKALVQVGPLDQRAQAMIVKPVGMALEIVPEQSPFALPRTMMLPVRVLYHGRPLAGALVKLTELAHDAEPVEMHRSDGSGRVAFAMPGHGSWLINVIWTRPQPRDRPNEFETDFSSLSFETQI